LLIICQTIELDPNFSKGHARKGAALHGLRRYPDAVMAYEAGLQVDPSSDVLKKGLAEVKKAMDSDPSNPMDQMNRFFTDPALFGKLEANPKTREYMKDAAFVQKIRQLQSGSGMPQDMLADPRMLTVLGVAMGIDLVSKRGQKYMSGCVLTV
jgi:stress-induced-phosphoprotein 1